ncbi:MAG TPA: FAD-dependent oxidoreductase [Thermoanaerobaculia bacterium]|nr:FAD-dependent oxidoreductase [Thermoanaerobaculia bacterium]
MLIELSILGGGPAGLGVAFYAHRAGVPFALFEGSLELGGMCRTLTLGAHRYDRGAHRFHDRDAGVTRDLLELMGDELVRVNAPSAIRDDGRFIDFPPTPLNVMFAYGVREASRICLDLVRSGLRRNRPLVTFEDFAVRRFGRTLARRILLNYSAKLWGLPTDQLSPDVATRRLQGMTLRSLLYELVFPGAKTEHVDGSFLYPRGGYGRISESLAATLPPESIRTGCEVAGLDVENGLVTRIRLRDGRSAQVRGRVVATLPLPLVAAMLGDALPQPARDAAARLRFRHVRLLFLRLGLPRLSRYASIYVPNPDYCVSRIYEPRNRSAAMAPEGETSLVVEAPCFDGDAVARVGAQAFRERVVRELASLGLLDPEDVIESREHFIPNAYPVYAHGYQGDVAIVQLAVDRISNLDTLGRAGRFVYSHLHDQLRYGRDYVGALVRDFDALGRGDLAAHRDGGLAAAAPLEAHSA